MISMSRLAEMASSKGVVVAGASTIALAAGFLTGYQYAKKVLEETYAQAADELVLQAKRQYAKLYKTEEWDSPESAAKALGLDEDIVLLDQAAEALRTYRNRPTPAVTEDGEVLVERAKLVEEGGRDLQAARTGAVIVRNIFEEQKRHVPPKMEDFEYADEVRNRSEEAPYVISKEEFFRNEEDMTQASLTYFVGDGVLIDSRDDVIENPDVTVGDDNLQRFGHRSEDPNVVYVRNHVMDVEFEISKHEGKYSVVVAGLPE